MATTLENAPANDATGEIRACWLEIGLYGDSSCPELPKHIHCRNCPVYSSAGARLLDRPLPEGYRREWTAHFAQQKQQRVPPARTSAVIFRIGSEWLALPTETFQEVAERRKVHSLPHRRNGAVLGLVNIRGELLICVDLSHVLGIGLATLAVHSLWGDNNFRASKDSLNGGRHFQHNDGAKAGLEREHRLLVVSWEGTRLVFPVDEVEGIHRFQSPELKPPPATVAKANQTYTQGLLLWQQKTIGFLNAQSLFPALNRTLS